MAKNLLLTRTESESLVTLLEDCDPAEIGTWRHDIAADIRHVFGMLSLEEEKAKAARIKETPLKSS